MGQVILVGANPALLLSEAGRPTAFASVWRVDWSESGRGTAIVLCRDRQTQAYGADERLCRWLVEQFTRHFPESADTGGAVQWVDTEVALDIDLDRGMRATGAGVVVELGQPLDRRVFRADGVQLAGAGYELSNVFVPCGTGTITVDGAPLPGAPVQTDDAGRPGSSAFLAVAEVWSRQ